jgi:tRNA-specific 2-thiouridylase
MHRAISLMSGGLDSSLAAKLVLDQGLEVIGLHLSSPWGCNADARRVSAHLGIPLRIVEKGADYVDLVRSPKYGYGKNMNPCIDCRIYMFLAAKKVMEEEQADFVVTGEVVGQRPMSQRLDAMTLIDRDSGMEGLVLRPLSAKELSPTLPEREGWVDREKLLDIVGRARKEQLALAKAMNLEGHASPAGGCLLTDPIFSDRLRGFFAENSRTDMAQIRMLRFGRHFQVGEKVRLILGRNQEENRSLLELARSEVAEGRMTLYQPLFPGPLGISFGPDQPEVSHEAARLILRYSKKKEPMKVEVSCGETRYQISLDSAAPHDYDRRVGA